MGMRIGWYGGYAYEHFSEPGFSQGVHSPALSAVLSASMLPTETGGLLHGYSSFDYRPHGSDGPHRTVWSDGGNGSHRAVWSDGRNR